ncbi:uncharacterized protein J4E79_006750 [Alternaria viburni]|uniref:uncharacterized protein n=1 Tax=Alternaria viburni TaxID=566460 RepID=UPI0020C57540|nr:uncharacterized protein J4E79_006750 [Alternaria viburni]KAI4658345.1 hypothetical protein J4E79_006750 [Alternaria viburni]
MVRDHQLLSRASHGVQWMLIGGQGSLGNIALILGALTAGGGITGYVRTGSIPSVVAGCTVGLLYMLGGYRVNSRAAYGVELALLASVILAGSSIPRAMKSGKPLPIGLSILATFGLWTFGNAYMNKARV